jgi:hypothetical protein
LGGNWIKIIVEEVEDVEDVVDVEGSIKPKYHIKSKSSFHFHECNLNTTVALY